MKIFKTIGIVLLSVIVLLLVISFFLPSQVHVERSRVIAAKPDAVFVQVNNLKNWFNWMPWNKKDPNMQVTWSDVTEGPGAKYSWASSHSEVGNGSVTISKSDPNKLVSTELDFMENGKASGDFIFEETAEGTKVTWTMDSDMGMNPVFKFLGLFMDGMVGPDFEQGLATLEETAKANPIPEPQEPIVTAPADSTQAPPVVEQPAQS
jgi:hypothetical protein